MASICPRVRNTAFFPALNHDESPDARAASWNFRLCRVLLVQRAGDDVPQKPARVVVPTHDGRRILSPTETIDHRPHRLRLAPAHDVADPAKTAIEKSLPLDLRPNEILHIRQHPSHWIGRRCKPMLVNPVNDQVREKKILADHPAGSNLPVQTARIDFFGGGIARLEPHPWQRRVDLDGHP